MSKNLKIALGVIVVLLGFIIINNINFKSDLPDVKELKADIDAIEIAYEGKKISIEKKDKKWYLGDKKYPADTSAVNRMINKVKKIKITDLISRKSFYQVYNLTPKKGVSVKIKEKGKIKRSILIGKKAPKGRQAYVRYNDLKPVYLMSGASVNDFKRNIDTLRDKKIFTISKDAIKEFTVNYKGRSFTFYKKEIEEKTKEKKQKKKKSLKIPEKKKKKKIWFCKGYGNTRMSIGRINAIISNFGPLRAAAFTDDKKESMKWPTAIITIKAFNKEISLKIFDLNDKKQYRATSSESPYVFTITKWRAKKLFLKNIEKLKE